VHIVGARPNFVKAAPVVSALADRGVPQTLVHTGQHYDERMSDVFFLQLGLPRPDIDLGVGSGTHAGQTAALLLALEQVFVDLRPSLVVVYGDVNSTLAAALVAAKLQVPVAHVEAGLRSFDMTMPEEVNRRVTDMLSAVHLVTSPEAIGHLAAEGIGSDGVHFVGNPMIDTLLANMPRFDPARARAEVGLGAHEPYGLVTLHRPANVDEPGTIERLVVALKEVSTELPLVFPLHPRGRAAFGAAGLGGIDRLTVVEPLGYIEFVSLMRGASLVVTDSGGVQEETTVLGVPCVTVRPNTERPVTISCGTNRLSSIDGLPGAALAALAGPHAGVDAGPPLWDGRAGTRIAHVLAGWLAQRDAVEEALAIGSHAGRSAEGRASSTGGVG
jgi:UDP-N-acetylglucosamine 2-epimerase (non-hydrolysing)